MKVVVTVTRDAKLRINFADREARFEFMVFVFDTGGIGLDHEDIDTITDRPLVLTPETYTRLHGTLERLGFHALAEAMPTPDDDSLIHE